MTLPRRALCAATARVNDPLSGEGGLACNTLLHQTADFIDVRRSPSGLGTAAFDADLAPRGTA